MKKENGGLGVRRLKEFNLALLGNGVRGHKEFREFMV